MQVPPLETERLIIRPFVMDDLETIHRILNEAFGVEERPDALDERRQWLQWSVLNYEQLARLHQPPYGDRAIVLKQSGELIGACGFVPCLNVFGLLPSLRSASEDVSAGLYSTEFGLFWAISPAHQRQGYATEAARTMIDYAFNQLHLKRIVATTEHDNVASSRVMEKVGMRIERNPYPDPPWLQVVGILENPLGEW